MTKRAIIVVGSESSGTRIFTRIIVEGGAYGHYSHQQLLDSFIFKPNMEVEEPLIVIRRSYPHDGEWADIRKIADALRKHGYDDIQLVVTVRDWAYTVPSMTRMRHRRPIHYQKNVDSFEQRESIAQEAFIQLFKKVGETNLPFIVVTYENLVQNTTFFMKWFKDKLELPKLPSLLIVDGNSKWRKKYNEEKTVS
jgi:hypothetical protein